jgi:hypothetical protein
MKRNAVSPAFHSGAGMQRDNYQGEKKETIH